MSEYCVCCGSEIPEGTQVCRACWEKAYKVAPPPHENLKAEVHREYHFTIYGVAATKKNSQVIAFNQTTHKPFISQNPRYKAWCKEVIKQLNAWTDRPQLPFDVPVRLTYIFYKDTKRLCDDLNLSAAMDDILVQAGVLADDNRDCVESHDGTRVLYDKSNPRVEVTITEMKGWEQWRKK